MNKEWFVFKGTHHLGPFSAEEIAEFYQCKVISPHTLICKEGNEKWEPISKVPVFSHLFGVVQKTIELPKPASVKKEIELPPVTQKKAPPKTPAKTESDEAPPPLPHIPTLPKAAPTESVTAHAEGQVELFDDELPPPIPLDAILDPKGEIKIRMKTEAKKSRTSKYFLFAISVLFIVVVAWFGMNEREAGIQLRIKGLMPVYLEKLEMAATRNTPKFEVAAALALDSQSLWVSNNKPGVVQAVIKLTSIPKRVLGTEDVTVTVKGEMKDHVGKFTRMTLTKGSKFLPGEYNIHAEGKQTHFINQHFKSLSAIAFFKSLNKSFTYDGTTLIYPGTPREFEKKLADYQSTITNELLKPYQDKLERIQTFESILNQTSQNYLMELEKAKTGKAMVSFEQKYIKEISPLLQALVVKANELSKDPKFNEEGKVGVIAPYREQILIGKQLGEMASDMITKTEKFKKLTDKDKSELRTEFDKRARGIKLQIDLNVKRLEDRINTISK